MCTYMKRRMASPMPLGLNHTIPESNLVKLSRAVIAVVILAGLSDILYRFCLVGAMDSAPDF